MLHFAAENAGKAVLAGGCVAGIGALCFYGLGLSNELGAVDKARCVQVTFLQAFHASKVGMS